MYSRAATVALTLAIVLPIIGIGAVLLYVDSLSPSADATVVEAAISTDSETPQVVEAETPVEPPDDDPDANPLQPIGPKASTRVTTPSSGACSTGGCTTPTTPRSGCSGGSSCGD